MSILRKAYYLTEVTRIHRGNSHGCPVNAKPLFLLSIIESIENGVLLNNKIHFNDNTIRDLYYDICQQYEPNRTPSPYILPYFHLISEWNGVPFVPSPNAHSPSGKYIRENARHSYLDQALWVLLQDFNVREEFRETIINFFIKPKEE